jgi:hypothetical protein
MPAVTRLFLASGSIIVRKICGQIRRRKSVFKSLIAISVLSLENLHTPRNARKFD